MIGYERGERVRLFLILFFFFCFGPAALRVSEAEGGLKNPLCFCNFPVPTWNRLTQFQYHTSI